MHRVTYRGHACMLANPLEMADPKAAFGSNPFVPVELDVRYLGLSPGYGGELRRQAGDGWVSVRSEKPGQEFAKGHLEQHGKAVGTLTIGGETFADRRARSPRSLVGTALLAGTEVLPLAHR